MGVCGLVNSVLNMKAAGYRAQIFARQIAWCTSLLLFLFLQQWSDGSHSIYWCSSWAIQISIFFILSGGSFVFHCLQVERPCSTQWPWLTNWLASQRSDSATLLNTTCWVLQWRRKKPDILTMSCQNYFVKQLWCLLRTAFIVSTWPVHDMDNIPFCGY